MTLRTKIEVFTDFTFVRSGPSYMHCCRAFPLRWLGFLVMFLLPDGTATNSKSLTVTIAPLHKKTQTKTIQSVATARPVTHAVANVSSSQC